LLPPELAVIVLKAAPLISVPFSDQL